MLEIVGNKVHNVEEIVTPNQTAIVRTFHDMLYHTEITVDKPSIASDGVNTATITATIKNYLGEVQTASTEPVVFEINGLQSDPIIPVNGAANITYQSTVPGVKTIKTVVPNYRNGEIEVTVQ